MHHVLSIQSAVTIGAVGNTMAGLVMSAWGHHLSRIDTVQLTAHPGYGFRAGGSLDDGDFADLIDGIDRLGVRFSAIVSGYLGRVGQIAPLSRFIAAHQDHHPDTPVVVDPAIGDHGRLYVDPEIAEGIKTMLVPLAQVITPNRFELSWLTGRNITTLAEAEAAARLLLEEHAALEAVVVTGVPAEQPAPALIADALITEQDSQFFEKPGAKSGFPGGGDMFTAILVAALVNGMSLPEATERASLLSHSILEESRKRGSAEIQLDAVRDHLTR